MPEPAAAREHGPLLLLLDQNVPRAVVSWLREAHSSVSAIHAEQAGLSGQPDSAIVDWARARGHVVVTFDEDLADQRLFPLGGHPGVIRLRVFPTTIEETQAALDHVLSTLAPPEIMGALVIVDEAKIRVRRLKPLTTQTQTPSADKVD